MFDRFFEAGSMIFPISFVGTKNSSQTVNIDLEQSDKNDLKN